MSTAAKYRRIKGACLRDVRAGDSQHLRCVDEGSRSQRWVLRYATLVETGESRTPRPESFTGRHLRA